MLGYRFLDDSTLTESQKAHYESDSESRKIFKVLDDRQVAETVWEAIGRIDNDVQVCRVIVPVYLITCNILLTHTV